MSAHTPGPWVARKIDAQEWAIDAPDGDPSIRHQSWRALAAVYGCDDAPRAGAQVAEANARLISAAPDLLEALASLLASCRAMPSTAYVLLDQDSLTEACAAIAKATGGQS